jgi:DNA-binding transcriptional MerR regulator
MHMHTKNNKETMAQWAKARSIRETRGISAPQLRRYADEGLIRTSNILRPGQTRGIRLFNVQDIDRLIEASITQHACDMHTQMTTAKTRAVTSNNQPQTIR